MKNREAFRARLEAKKEQQREADERERDAARKKDGRLRARKRPAR